MECFWMAGTIGRGIQYFRTLGGTVIIRLVSSCRGFLSHIEIPCLHFRVSPQVKGLRVLLTLTARWIRGLASVS